MEGPHEEIVLSSRSSNLSISQSRNGYQHKSIALDFVCLDKMYADKMLCDVTLVAEQMEIFAHKLVLAASSTFFYWKFTNDRKLGLIKRIEIKDMTFETLSSVIAYIYSTEILITEKNVENLLRAAHLFALCDLQKACQDFLQANLTVSNCLNTEVIARQTFSTNLELAAGYYRDAHFSDIIKDVRYLRLTYENFVRVISSDTLSAREADVLECVLKWIAFDVENRKHHVYDLMEHVRFPLIPQNHILQKFEEKWLQSDPRYYQFMVDIERRHILNVPRVLSSEYRQSKLLVVVGATYERQLSLEIYDGQKKSWFECPEILNIECGYSPRIAIFGSTVYWADDSKLHSIDISNPKRLKFSGPKDLLVKRQYASVAVFNNHIYAIGGLWNGQYRACAEKFDIVSRSWTKIANMRHARHGVGLCVFKEMLYAFGGLITRTEVCNTVECYRRDTDSWCTLPEMAFSRSCPGVAVLGNKIYVVGGGSSNMVYKFVEVLDPEEGSWSRIPDMAVPRSGPGVIAIEDRLYVIGGRSYDHSNARDLNSVEVFDPLSNTWSMLPSPMHRRKYCIAVDLVDKSNIELNKLNSSET